jgi:archaellum component FlaC
MKKFLMLAAVFGITVFAANKLMAANRSPKASEINEDSDDSENDGLDEMKSRFEKLGNTIKDDLETAEENLKNAADDKKAEIRKTVDALKRQAKDVQKGTERLGEDIKGNWESMKNELSGLADKVEKDLRK